MNEDTQKEQEQKLAEENQTTEEVKNEQEFGGRKEGLEPTRYGDWELKGKCVDF